MTKVQELTPRSGDQPFALSYSANTIYTVSLHSALLKGYKIKTTAFDVASGKQGSQHTLSSDGEVTSEDSILHVGSNTASPLLAWTDKAHKVLKFNIIGTKHIATINVDQSVDEAIESIKVTAPRGVDAPAHFLVQYQGAKTHWAEVYHVKPSTGAATKAYALPPMHGVAAYSSSTDGKKVYFTEHTDFEIALLSSDSDEVLAFWPTRPKADKALVDPQPVLHAVSEVIPKNSYTFAIRSALNFPSGDWQLIQNGKSVWTKSESIAGAVAAAWVDGDTGGGLTQELAAEARGGLVGTYIHRLSRHARELANFLPAWIENLPNAVTSTISGEQLSSVRNSFGFDKIVLVATERGRVAAIETGKQGRVVWNVQAVKIPSHQRWQVLGIEVEEGIAFIRGLEGEFLRIKASSGEILQYQPGGLISSLKTSASITDINGKRISIPMNNDGSINEIPQSDLPDGTVVVGQGNDGIIKGWTISRNAKPYIAWTFIPGPNERIASLIEPASSDSVASIGKALGDRNVLYKYLNPNLLAVVTVKETTSTATIHLLDSASGDVLYSSSHAHVDTSQAIPLTLAENWIAYSLYIDQASTTQEPSSKAPTSPKGYQLIVSELFESSIPNDRGPLGYASNFSSIHPSSDETSSTPHIFSQAYLLPGPISKITTSSTLQSITPRSLICILPALNALISIPRSITDPRRPVGRDPTPSELEEGLYRHNAQLDFEPKWVLTHKREVMGLTDVITTPSQLESTSLVFAYGELDVFGTRVTPIGEFDSLGKGFSRLQLVLTVVGLGVVVGGLAPMVSDLILGLRIGCLWDLR